MKYCLGLLLLLLTFYAPLRAEVQDPLDPFSMPSTADEMNPGVDPDKDKSARELVLDATVLMGEEKLLDARTKLLKALQKDPKEYQAHLMLGTYYMIHVGHFRLALRYTKQALNLFIEKNGPPPYTDFKMQAEHAQLLYLVSQARLNLDDYPGALQALDEYSSFGYFSNWYAGSRAWVLMKLGKLQEAIQVARMGVLSGSEPGRTLNMLGILLSMNDERESSLQVFQEAIRYEMSLGTEGQPATPLNNSGEVYKEIFLEDKAEAAWRKATSLPDGCEHVLPALNLSLLYLEQLNYEGAATAMKTFEQCIAQFPLRNGEEHIAFVNFIRGRVALHTGHVNEALRYLEIAMEHRQWFGKIGTNENDLEVAVYSSLAAALEAKNNFLRSTYFGSPLAWADAQLEMTLNEVRAWWLRKKARRLLAEEMNFFEDIYIRNTDSMLEYPTLGDLIAGFGPDVIEQRVALESRVDHRSLAKVYYQAYLAQAYQEAGDATKARELYRTVLNQLRPKYDDSLRVHCLVQYLKFFDPSEPEYTKRAYEIYALNPSKLRNYGFLLPVNYQSTAEPVKDALDGKAFIFTNASELPYAIRFEQKAEEMTIELLPRGGRDGTVKAKGTELESVLNRFVDEVFSQAS